MKSTKLEDKLIEKYGGTKSGVSGGVPQTLVMDHVSPATRLLEKRRQMFEVQEALNAQNEEFARREDAFRRREEGLRRKDLELQESLIKFNKFLQENESKRNRALKRAADERKQRELKEQEIKRLEVHIREKMAEEQSLKGEVQANVMYQEFLENVVLQLTKDFPEISDVLNRYKTLKDVNEDLTQKKIREDELTENEMRKFAAFRKEMENRILNGSNDIAEKQILLEQSQVRNKKLQAEIDAHNLESSEKTLQLGQVFSSVSNLIERCEDSFRKRHNKPSVQRSYDTTGMDLVEQCHRSISKLEEIAMFMVDYIDICKDYETDMALERETAGANNNNNSTRTPKTGGPSTAGGALTAGGSVDARSTNGGEAFSAHK